MLEIITTFTVALASKLTILAEAIQSISVSVGLILAAIGTSVLSISGGLAWVATILPVPQSTSGLYYNIYKYINIFGANIGNASNVLKVGEK